MTPNERPILFSGEMVRAILDGRKTQTRRVVKEKCFGPSDTRGYEWHYRCKRGLWQDMRHSEMMQKCPYGVPGDRLWVRETWKCSWWGEGEPERIAYKAGGKTQEVRDTESVSYDLWSESMAEGGADDLEKAGWKVGEDDLFHHEDCNRAAADDLRWRPSIHMPRWASRITLEVTDVRVERLQKISEADAIAEGCVSDDEFDAKDRFEWLWESINGEGSWEANPWVWVVEFRRVEP